MLRAALLVLLAAPAVATVPCPEYESIFRQSARRYLADKPIPWNFLAAQVYAESACRPDAVSHVGAQGPA